METPTPPLPTTDAQPNTDAPEALDLIEQLANATKAPPPTQDVPFEPLEHGANMPPDFEPTATNGFDDDFNDAPADDAPDSNVIGDTLVSATFPPAKLAKTIITIADKLLVSIMPSVYMNGFTKTEIYAMKTIGERLANGDATNITDAEQIAILNYKEFEDYKQTLPLDADEKATILAPLTEVLKYAKYETTPMNALLMAVGMVALPRALPILAKKINL